jgi:predicted enzyme related to lactoylglutathione lyase
MATASNMFFWYELLTDDLEGALAFYTKVIGWQTQDFPSERGDRYVVLSAGGAGLGGAMQITDEMCTHGVKPHWGGYIHVDDVDAKAVAIAAAGGTVLRGPDDIPGVGRFAVLADPQGAAFMVLAPSSTEAMPTPSTPIGQVGWHELHSTDGAAGFDFYAGQFGWTRDLAVDMGPMGTYQLFAAGGPAVGGMMTMMPGTPVPHWLFYFNVDEIHAAATRIEAAGGKILMPAHEVPGGSWIVMATDPQGAAFAVVQQAQ